MMVIFVSYEKSEQKICEEYNIGQSNDDDIELAEHLAGNLQVNQLHDCRNEWEEIGQEQTQLINVSRFAVESLHAEYNDDD